MARHGQGAAHARGRRAGARPGSTATGSRACWRRRATAFDDEAIDEYWKGLADDAHRRAALELYRSGDFEKLAGYRLADLGVPVLLLWGENDEFAPPAGAHRFERELPDTELVVIEGAGHFVWDEQPRACAGGAARLPGEAP